MRRLGASASPFGLVGESGDRRKTDLPTRSEASQGIAPGGASKLVSHVLLPQPGGFEGFVEIVVGGDEDDLSSTELPQPTGAGGTR
jgi:hypothetical protein